MTSEILSLYISTKLKGIIGISLCILILDAIITLVENVFVPGFNLHGIDASFVS
jgi:hypothetical protein